MILFLTIVVFILTLSILVITHEFGHYITAKRNGIRVEEFGVGYPPRIIGFYKSKITKKWRSFWGRNDKHRDDIDGTIYSINYIIFGGFVRMLGEEVDSDSKQSFSQKSPWIRAKVIIAGVLFNFILAWILLTLWFWVVPRNLPNNIVVVSVAEHSAAAKANISANDFLLKINGQKLSSVELLQKLTKENQGKTITLTVNHFGKEIDKSIILPQNTDAPLGISLAESGTQEIPQFPWWKAPYYAFLEIIGVIWMSLSFIIGIFTSLFAGHKPAVEMVSGPVGVFGFLYQIINFGPAFIMRFIAIISIAVGFFNLLPFPGLDGGHLVFIIGEAIRGKKIVKAEWENALHWFGFIALLILFVLITYNDINKWIIK